MSPGSSLPPGITVPRHLRGTTRLIEYFEMGVQHAIYGTPADEDRSPFDRPRSKYTARAYQMGVMAGQQWREQKEQQAIVEQVRTPRRESSQRLWVSFVLRAVRGH